MYICFSFKKWCLHLFKPLLHSDITLSLYTSASDKFGDFHLLIDGGRGGDIT